MRPLNRCNNSLPAPMATTAINWISNIAPRPIATCAAGQHGAGRSSGIPTSRAAPEKGQDEISEQRLAAFVVRPGLQVQWIELGPTKPIADAVDRWRKSYSTSDGAELRRLVWQPLEAKIEGAKRCWFRPTDRSLAFRLPRCRVKKTEPI